MLGLTASRRMAVLLAIAVVAALAGVAIGCVSEEEANGTVGPVEEHVADPQCLERIGTEFPAQHPTPAPPERIGELTRILCGNEAVKAIVAGREIGLDYWIAISYVYDYRRIRNYGEEPIAMVDFFFDPPVSYAGEVAVIATDPCRGHGVEGDLDPNDPCVDEPKEYGSAYREFIDAQGVTAEVDFRRLEVVEVFQNPGAAESIEHFRRLYAQ